MPWIFANENKTTVTDGRTTIPLGVNTGTSRNMDMLIASGLEIGPYVAPAVESVASIAKPTYTLETLVDALVAKGIVPKPDGA